MRRCALGVVAVGCTFFGYVIPDGARKRLVCWFRVLREVPEMT